MSDGRSKIAIVGAGAVGATLAYACLLRGVGNAIALYDPDASKVDAAVLDLSQGFEFLPAAATLEGSADPEVCRDADVLVIAIGERQTPGQSRLDLAAANAATSRELIPRLVAVAPGATLLIVTHPVDVLTYAALKISGLPRQRVCGSGTVLESARFRSLIAGRLRVAVRDVHAYIAGGQGGGEIPLWSSAHVANVPLHAWAVPGHGKLTVRDRTEIFLNVTLAAERTVGGEGGAHYAAGLAATEIIEALLNDEGRVLPVSSLLADYQGIDDVCLSVPCIVSGAGIENPLPIPLNDAEVLGLRNSAELVKPAIKSMGF